MMQDGGIQCELLIYLGESSFKSDAHMALSLGAKYQKSFFQHAQSSHFTAHVFHNSTTQNPAFPIVLAAQQFPDGNSR